MTKLSKKPLPKDFGHYVNNLWAAFTLLQTKADIRLLFKDMFTHTEYKMFAKRLEIARRLLSLQKYEKIRKELSVTNTTISTVSNVLASQGDGLRKAAAALSALEEKYRKSEQQHLDSMANPFKRKAKRSTVLGKTLAFGLKELDKKLVQRAKRRSAVKDMEL